MSVVAHSDVLISQTLKALSTVYSKTISRNLPSALLVDKMSSIYCSRRIQTSCQMSFVHQALITTMMVYFFTFF